MDTAEKKRLLEALQDAGNVAGTIYDVLQTIWAVDYIDDLDKRISRKEIEQLGTYDANGKFIEIPDIQKAFEQIIEWMVGESRKELILEDFQNRVKNFYRISPYLRETTFEMPFLTSLSFALEQKNPEKRSVKTMFSFMFHLFEAMNLYDYFSARGYSEEQASKPLEILRSDLCGTSTNADEEKKYAVDFFDKHPELMSNFIRFTIQNGGVDYNDITAFLNAYGFAEATHRQVFRKTANWLENLLSLPFKNFGAVTDIMQLNIGIGEKSSPVMSLDVDSILGKAERIMQISSNGSRDLWKSFLKSDDAAEALKDDEIRTAVEDNFLRCRISYHDKEIFGYRPEDKLKMLLENLPYAEQKDTIRKRYEELKSMQRYNASLNEIGSVQKVFAEERGKLLDFLRNR